MHVLDSFEDLIHNVFLMNVFHDTSPNNSMQISFHKVKDEINVFGAFGLDDVEKTDDIGVAIKLLEENDLS